MPTPEPECQLRSDIYMAHLNEHIEQHRLKRDEIMSEVTDAAGESSKILAVLSRTLDGHDSSTSRSPSSHRR